MKKVNAIEQFRKSSGLSYEQLKAACGFSSRSVVYYHCQGKNISAESALRYHQSLGIPLSELRPDLWPPKDTPVFADR